MLTIEMPYEKVMVNRGIFRYLDSRVDVDELLLARKYFCRIHETTVTVMTRISTLY